MNIQEKCVETIRLLSVDAIEKAGSGHPGLPLGAAAIGYELFAHHLNYNPAHPDFLDRDRFVLSAGHGTMLLYSLLHLFGFSLSMEDIKNFRQLGSKTPGHPEYGVTAGVDVSTGPLGQGIANAVGMAMAETMMAAKYNRDGFKLFDHYTYALCGEGCLMEGLSYEATSLAGTLALGKLILIYDCNRITIEGDISTSFDEDIAGRFAAQGWQVLRVENGNDPYEIGTALVAARADENHPSIVIVKTKIGHGSQREGMASSHGAPLGKENIKMLREKLGLSCPEFSVEQDVYLHCKERALRGVKKESDWNKQVEKYAEIYPDLFSQLQEDLSEKKRVDLSDMYSAFSGKISTRKASHILLCEIARQLECFVGGSADLGPSNLSVLDGLDYYSKDNRGGRNIHFGIREHAMSAIINGMCLHGGLLPFCATFFAFSDYMKNGVRMSAIMGLPVIYVFTHDSIAVGEDGPTHEPIEHLAGLRAMPNLNLFRPADAKETIAAYESAFKTKKPTAIVLSRQDLPVLAETSSEAAKGGYVVYGEENTDAILLSTGSEVSLCIAAAKKLFEEGVKVRVVSLPSFNKFFEQSKEYREKVLPKGIKNRMAVEAASSLSWGGLVGLDGEYLCIDCFGESGKPEDLKIKFSMTEEEICKRVKKMVRE